MHYDLTTLANGVRVITQPMPEIRSVAVGCWVDSGSRDEHDSEAGSSHFLEHLLFKGSDRIGGQEIAERFDAVGAQSNAFTTRESTCFWARLRDADLPMGIELLSEMLQRPAFRADDFDSERHVVLEEINMNEDDPGDVAHEEFTKALWAGNRLSLPILGTRASITGMSVDTVAGYWRRRYVPASLVVAAAGNLSHDDVVTRIAAEFGDWRGGSNGHDGIPPVPATRTSVRRRDTEQAHLVIGGPELSRDDKRRFAAGVLSHVLGGGMSSRLFQVIREERGLAYAVYSFRMPHRDTGAWGVYVGTTPNQAGEVLRLVRAELDRLATDGISPGELERARGHAKGSLAISTEEANSRMTRLGRAELAGMEHLTVDELVECFEAVTAEDVLDLAREVYARPSALGAVGPFDDGDLSEFVG
jgi:predicted Zn-dependent peptidase